MHGSLVPSQFSFVPHSPSKCLLALVLFAAIAFFVHPEDDTVFAPLNPAASPRTADEESEFEGILSRKGLAPGTRRITSGDYLRQRIASTYAPKEKL